VIFDGSHQQSGLHEDPPAMLWIEFAIVLLCIFLGARVGGVGLGTIAAFGLAILIFVFGAHPGPLPIDVIFIIVAVIAAAAAMQAAGGLDLLVAIASKILRRRPQSITFVAPAVAWLFTFVAGTGHVAYSILPVIAEVSRKAGVRPERPMSISVIASQQAITASPVSAATAAMIALFAANESALGLKDILLVCIPATFLGCMLGAVAVMKMGKELADDPVYQERLARHAIRDVAVAADDAEKPGARASVVIFLIAVAAILVLGIFPSLLPSWEVDGKVRRLSMAYAIEILMLCSAGATMLIARFKPEEMVSNSVMRAGIVAVISILGIAWLGSTFFEAHRAEIEGGIADVVKQYPWVFSIGLFTLSILLYSQAATVAAMMHVGVGLGISLPMLIAMFPAVNGYFFLPTYGTIVAAISFDQTGTTGIGKYVLNHSFMVPGLVACISAVGIGLAIVAAVYG
jgi:anaerobic C4-dicarboxylate transporter DcuA